MVEGAARLPGAGCARRVDAEIPRIQPDRASSIFAVLRRPRRRRDLVDGSWSRGEADASPGGVTDGSPLVSRVLGARATTVQTARAERLTGRGEALGRPEGARPRQRAAPPRQRLTLLPAGVRRDRLGGRARPRVFAGWPPRRVEEEESPGLHPASLAPSSRAAEDEIASAASHVGRPRERQARTFRRSVDAGFR